MPLKPNQSAIYIDEISVTEMPVSVQENVPARTEFIIYPNPFQNEIMVKCSLKDQFEIHLIDLMGKKIQSNSFVERTSLQTDNLESGIYLYEIRGQQQMVKRVILN